jgi:tetratricopeptide (TPR) repeat protein
MGRTAIWLLAYWLAFLFAAQADVFLEGPMGGIWFWSLTGVIWVFLFRLSNQEPQYLTMPPWLTQKGAVAFGAIGMFLLTAISLPLLMTMGYQKLADDSARIAVSTKQPEYLAQAAQYAQQAIAYNHQITGLMNYRLGIAYQELQLLDDAHDYYQLALQAGNLRNRLMADLLLRIASYYAEIGKHSEAIEYIQRVLEINPDRLPAEVTAQANFQMAMSLWQPEQDLLPVRDYLEKSLLLKYDPKTLDRYLKLIGTVRDQGGEDNLQQAMEMAIFATEVQPGSTWTALLRCSVHLARRELETATEWCLRSRDLAPGNYHSYVWLGLVYQKRELWEEALVNFEKAASLTTDNSWTLSLADRARKKLAKF